MTDNPLLSAQRPPESARSRGGVMGQRVFLAVAIPALLLCAVSAPAKPRAEVLPPDIGWDHDFLNKHREPPLWTPDALSRHKSRLRLSIDGIMCLRVIIRIDETRGGSFQGTYIAEQKCKGRPRSTEVTEFDVRRRDMAELLDLARRNGILQQPRQGWNMGEDDFCLDGEEVLIERADAQGYRAAGANVPCTAPSKLTEVALGIIDLADAREARKLVE